MKMMQFTCECGQALKVSTELAGWKTKCTGCQQMVSVPDPTVEIRAAAAASESPTGSFPWKWIAIGASAVALIAIIAAVAGGGSKPSTEEPDAATLRLKKTLEERDREIARLEDERAKHGDPVKLEARAITAEKERDALRKELTAALRQAEDYRMAGTPRSNTPSPVAPSSPDESPASPAPSGVAKVESLEQCPGTVVLVGSDQGVGGGFFISADGLVVTSYRVIAKSLARKVMYIENTGGSRVRMEAEASVLAVDIKNDLALIKANVRRLVPYASLALAGQLASGQEVVMFGNPPPGTKSVDHSTTKGGIVALDLEMDGARFIQTAIPLSSVNAGVPLFNLDGKVVAVTTVKGEASNVAGLAIPVAFVHALFDGRDTLYNVGVNFTEWEAKQGASGALPRGADGKVEMPPGAIPMEGVITKMILDEENDRIIAVEGEKGRIVVISVSKRKVLRTVTTGTNPVDVQLTGNADVAWVSHPSSRNIVKVDVAEGRVFDRVDAGIDFKKFAASRNHVWLASPGRGRLVFLRDKKIHEINMKLGSVAYDRRRDRVIGVNYRGESSQLVEVDGDKAANTLRDISEIEVKGPEHPRWKELADLRSQLESSVKTWPAPADTAEWMSTTGSTTIVPDSSPRLYINRAVIRRDKLDVMLARLPEIRFSKTIGQAAAEALSQFEGINRIQCGSSNGRWIATGTHIYSTDAYAMHKELPVPTPTSAFSGDSKTLFIFDYRCQAIVPVDVESK